MRAVILLLAVFAGSLFAEPVFMIELGMKGILKPGSHSPGLEMTSGTWRKEGKNTKLIIRGDASPEWKKYSFTFIPQKNGTTELTLKSSSNIPAAFDDLALTGAVLLNGSFEELRIDRRTPAGWGVGYGTMTSKDPASGKLCIAVSREHYAVQSFRVNAGAEIKLEFQVRSAYKNNDQNEEKQNDR